MISVPQFRKVGFHTLHVWRSLFLWLLRVRAPNNIIHLAEVYDVVRGARSSFGKRGLSLRRARKARLSSSAERAEWQEQIICISLSFAFFEFALNVVLCPYLARRPMVNLCLSSSAANFRHPLQK